MSTVQINADRFKEALKTNNNYHIATTQLETTAIVLGSLTVSNVKNAAKAALMTNEFWGSTPCIVFLEYLINKSLDEITRFDLVKAVTNIIGHNNPELLRYNTNTLCQCCATSNEIEIKFNEYTAFWTKSVNVDMLDIPASIQYGDLKIGLKPPSVMDDILKHNIFVASINSINDISISSYAEKQIVFDNLPTKLFDIENLKRWQDEMPEVILEYSKCKKCKSEIKLLVTYEFILSAIEHYLTTAYKQILLCEQYLVEHAGLNLSECDTLTLIEFFNKVELTSNKIKKHNEELKAAQKEHEKSRSKGLSFSR